eukprot:TRINITY_DN3569_c0_g1_i1.p2 TRINITY_DN3569_c0_g1~~TRINITY_DN3569_c0_g1_i1.p2  ORF type:complete len:137 (-),score=24.36 TRINITY_DN3569_c0_g1_i1:341-751(-)
MNGVSQNMQNKPKDLGQSQSQKRNKLHWDEQNLEENEIIKKELNTTKIDEPKTPFHRPSSIADEIDESMVPFNLDGSNNPVNVSVPEVVEKLAASTHEEFVNKRKQHYDMQQALQRGKELIMQEEDDKNDPNSMKE